MKKRKSLGKLKTELQKIVNKKVRERDSEDGYFTCISCGKVLPIEKMNAGHFYPVGGYDGLRFDFDNIHGECAYCNKFDQAHLINYSINLRRKIGEKRFKALMKKARDYKKGKFRLTRLGLKEIKENIKNA